MAPTDTEAAAALHWVKLRSMPVFWPACVYTSYSDAVEYTHDVWPLRSDKPVLDAEDRVLYFFGVGPRACHVVASGSAPNLQLCVAHEDDLTLEKWTSAEEFPLLCGKYQVPEDLAKRAENNSCFLRACEEAETYVKDVQTKEQASELFVTLLTMAKKAHTTGKAVVVREIIPSPAKTQKKTAKKTSQQIEQEKAIEVARMLKTPEMGTMVAKCWQQMLEAGWETMAQGDGQVLYKMPGTTFFNLVPNINLFDSLEKACGRYLSEWVKSVAVDDSSDDFSDLTEFLWPMAAGSGWEGLATASEILYKKKDLPFDQWVPNVTIFRSKTQAVAKYLEECGLISSNNDSTPEEEDAQDNVSDIAASDVDMEEVEQSEDQCQIYEVECDGGEESEDGESEVEEGNQEEEPPAAPVKAAAKPKRSTKKHQQQQKKKQRRYLENMPSFKMSFGKLEAELMRRGWYYRNGPLHFLYYQPYCKTMNSKTLKANKDYFRGQEELESFARTCGLYDEVEAKLRAELYDLCTLESEEDSENDEETQVAPPTKVPANTQAPASKRAPASKPVSKASKVVLNASKPLPSIQQTKAPARRERSHARSGSRNTQSKPAPRSRVGLSTSTTLAEVKFGEIWRVLADDGWHYRYSSLECDYFKPHCDTAKDGIAGKDYFQSKDLLIEYLQTSGIWDATAARVRAEAAMDSSDEDMIDSDTETATPVQKRKRNDSTPAPQPSSKKYKDTFRTPTLKRLATADLSDDDEDMDTISPDAAGTKGKENNGSGRQPLRNLANSFTPSPNTTRKEKEEKKGPQHSANDDVAVDPAKSSPRNLIQSAIQKLTSAYIPTNFRHREKEFREIREFFSDCFDGKEEKTSLYISGAPGCGKSALLKATQSEIDTLYQDCCPDQAKKPVRCHINAMALTDSATLFCKLAEALTSKSFSNGNEAFEAIERATTRRLKSSKTMILILDEIDTLLKNNGIESDLCRLFELAHRDSNSFILIGIANQVDFTERHLPMLKQRLPEYSPRVIIFEPYKHQTIEHILTDRLGGQATASKMVSTHGISFLARKIASTTGDIRLAVDTCRRVLQHKLDHADKENGSEDAELGRPLPLTDMLRIIKHALESKSALVIRSLPRNLQMILFASTRLLIVTANRAAENGREATPLFSVDELYTSYCEASKDAGVFKPLSVRDFRTALDTLGEEGLIAEAELRKHLIKLLFSTSELLQSFRKDPFFSRLV